VLPHVPQGGAGTHAGGQAVVDDDDVTAAHVGFGGAPAVDLHAAAGLALFDGDRVGQPVLGEAEPAQGGPVEDGRTLVGRGADGDLRAARNRDLAGHDHVQW